MSRPSAALVAVLALCLLPACGSDDEESSSSSSSEGAPTPMKLAADTSEVGGRVRIAAPSTVKAGLVEISFNNAGKRLHDLQLVRVDGEQGAQQVVNEVIDHPEGAPTPDWAHAAGGVGSTAPGQTGTATELLEAGTYYLVDTETAGGQGEGETNAKKGGVAKLEVTGEVSGELPSTPARIVAREYTLESSGLKAGTNQVTFDNAGEELHHVIAFPVMKGATFAEVKKVFASEEPPKGPPPVDFEQAVGTAVLDGREKQVTELQFEAGKYALVCFVSDRKGGPPHVAKGMISEVDVK